MADDWIKMRTDIYRDPKVCVMADLLMHREGRLATFVNQHCQRDMTVTRNVMRNVTVGALVTLWGVTRHRGKRVGDDLLLRGASIEVVDDIADLPGLGQAMLAVGWAEDSEEGVVFPHFFQEFNTDPKEEAKSKNAERQRRYREKNNVTRNVTVTSQSNGREEKRREENIDTNVSNTPLPPSGEKSARTKTELVVSIPEAINTPEFRTAWESWEKHRKEIRKPLTPTQAAAQLRKFCEWGPAEAIAAINHTIAMGWQGIRRPEVASPTFGRQPQDLFGGIKDFVSRAQSTEET